MVLDKKETTVAYRCPVCGASVMSMIGIFALTADLIKLKCPCGESELELVYTRDKKIRLNVPCLFCPTPHSYIISSQMFFERDLFTIPCNYSGIDICFIGRQDKVQEAMKKSEKELLETTTLNLSPTCAEKIWSLPTRRCSISSCMSFVSLRMKELSNAAATETGTTMLRYTTTT